MKYFFPNYGKPLLERIKTAPDHEFKIEAYGEFNVYPQLQEQLRLASPLIKAATETLADFIDGNGFTENGDAVMSEDGEQANDLLNLVAKDFSQYDGFALWVGFNGSGKIEEVKHIPFEFVRFGMPDALGKHKDVKVSNNWEQNPDVDEGQRIKPKRFPLFNQLTAAEETVSGGSGQVLYYTGVKDKYPLSTFDSINDTGRSDKSIQEFEANSSARNFNGTTIFKYPGEFESDEEQREITEKIQQLQGPKSPGIVLAKVDEEFTGNLIKTIPPNNTDALFALTRQAIIDRTLMAYKIPPALIGINPSGGVFTQTAYQDSFLTFNITTRTRRKIVSRVFNIVGELMGVSFGEVQENQYDIEATGIEPDEVVTEEAPEVIQETIETPEEAEAVLKKLYG